MMNTAKAILKNNEEKDILEGFPWVYANEVDHFDGKINSGGLIDVCDSKGKFLARGYLNTSSKIIIRILTLIDEDIDSNFIYNRIKKAYDLRESLGVLNACRLIFSEGDYLPGVVVDKYGDYLVIEIATLGMENYRSDILKALNEIVKPLGIYERSNTPSRRKEGLEDRVGYCSEPFNPNITIVENGIKLQVNIENGQKTGYFFDQRENRAAIKPFVKNKRVLDCCTHTGSFAIHALKYEAREVVAVDISDTALEEAKINATINGYTNIEFIKSDLFAYLSNVSKGEFDVIILDPPAFIKNASAMETGLAGYEKANSLALSKLNENGILITFSCSGLLKIESFLEMLKKSAKKAKVSTELLSFSLQGKDHPMLLAKLEKLYLKCAIIRVVKNNG